MSLVARALRLYRQHLARFLVFRFMREIGLSAYRGAYRLRSMAARRPESGRYRWCPLSKAGKSCISSVRVGPEETINIPAPAFSGEGAAKAAERTPARAMLSPAAEIFELSESIAVGGVDFIFVGDTAFHHDLYHPGERCPAENVGVVTSLGDNTGLHLYLTREAMQVKAAVSLIGQVSSNYAHWLTETLPKLAVLDASGKFATLPLLVDEGLHPNILASLDIIGRHRREIIQVARWQAVRAERLVAISSPGYERYLPHDLFSRSAPPYFNRFSKAALGTLRSAALAALGPSLESARPPGIYLARAARSGNLRQVTNGAELEQIARERRLGLVMPEAMTFAEQAKACLEARVLVGPGGATLANMVFAPPGCQVIVLAPYYEDHYFFYLTNLAAALGHRIHYVLGCHTETHGHVMHRSYHIDETVFRTVLDECLASARQPL